MLGKGYKVDADVVQDLQTLLEAELETWEGGQNGRLWYRLKSSVRWVAMTVAFTSAFTLHVRHSIKTGLLTTYDKARRMDIRNTITSGDSKAPRIVTLPRLGG